MPMAFAPLSIVSVYKKFFGRGARDITLLMLKRFGVLSNKGLNHKNLNSSPSTLGRGNKSLPAHRFASFSVTGKGNKNGSEASENKNS